MTQTRNHIPAILLAAIVAVAMVFALTAMAQNSYAAEDQAKAADSVCIDPEAIVLAEDAPSQLEVYEVSIGGVVDREDMPSIIYTDGTTPITPQITLRNGDYLLPDDKYTLEYKKGNLENWTFEPTALPLGVDADGTAVYTVQAFPKAGSGLTGESDIRTFFVCSRSTVTWPSAEIKFDAKYFVDPHKVYEDPHYEVPLGETLKPTVVVDGKTLQEGTDYIVDYIDHSHGHGVIENFPDKTGVYACQITGRNAYFGMNQETLLYMGDKNPMTATAKAVTVKASKLKKKAQTIKPITIKNAAAAVHCWAIDGNAKSLKALKVDEKTGKVTVKKGTKKGTYKAIVEIWADPTDTIGPGRTVVEVTVKVK